MPKTIGMLAYFLIMGALIVGLDVAFLKNHLLLRLLVNVSIVAVFAAAYFLFIKRL